MLNAKSTEGPTPSTYLAAGEEKEPRRRAREGRGEGERERETREEENLRVARGAASRARVYVQEE